MMREEQRRAMFAQMAAQKGSATARMSPVKRKKHYPFTRGVATGTGIVAAASVPTTLASMAITPRLLSKGRFGAAIGAGVGLSAATAGLGYAVARKFRGPAKYTEAERQDYQTAVKGAVFGTPGLAVAGYRVRKRRKQRGR